MTPGERVVVEAAIRWADRADISATVARDLRSAVNALLAERQGGEPVEQDITWGEVVKGDQVWNARVGQWFIVTRAAHTTYGISKIAVHGVPKLFERGSGTSVKVKRGDTGKVVDMFASVLWSGA